MTEASDAWQVVQIAELARADEDLLVRVLRVLDPAACAGMREDDGWVLSGSETEELRSLLVEHGEIAERLQRLAERLPEQGIVATYSNVRAGAAATVANGTLDLSLLLMAVSTLDVRAGWIALADALASTDVREAWELTMVDLLSAFRAVDPGLVSRVLAYAAVDPETYWSELSADQTRRLAAALRSFAEQSE